MKDNNNKEIKFKLEELQFVNHRKEMTFDDLADGVKFENQEMKFKSKLPKARNSFKPRR